MKNLLNYISAALILSLMVFASCGGGDDDTGSVDDPRDEAAMNLEGTAELASVTKPDNATELDWTGFEVTFNGNADGGGFTTRNSADLTVWPESGTWVFANEQGTVITRSAPGEDDVDVEIRFTLDPAAVNLQFDIDTTAPAKAAGVIEGRWVFVCDYIE